MARRRERQQPWAFHSYLALGAFPEAVPCARLHARLIVREWGLAELAEVVELVTSEIVTNAVQASEGLTGCRLDGRWRPGRPPVRLWVRCDRQRVLVQVWDGEDCLPVRQAVEPDAESGRGLLLVETLSEARGVYRAEGCSGKVVWAVVATAATAGR
jgi:anti-sigma regulatory factor (Ser/Thr protein kinase)